MHALTFVYNLKTHFNPKQEETNMKKLISLMLAIAMLLTSFAVPAFAEEADADVIVIGAGGGGLSAALEAAAQGAKKVIVHT